MNCIFCHNDPCTCGEAYRSLNKKGLLVLMLNLTDILKERDLTIETLIDGTPLSSYLASMDVAKGSSLLATIDASTDIPEIYRKHLEQFTGRSLAAFYEEFRKEDFGLKFPLMLYLRKREPSKTAFFGIICDMIERFVLGDDVYRYNDLLPACRKADTFDALQYALQQIIYRSIGFSIDKSRTNSVASNVMRLSKLLEDDAHFFYNVTEFMCSICDPSLVKYFREKGYTNFGYLSDELMTPDYQMVNVLLERPFVSNDTI